MVLSKGKPTYLNNKSYYAIWNFVAVKLPTIWLCGKMLSIILTMIINQDERLIKSEKSRGDQTVEIILATTALVTVIALFLR